MCLAQQQHIQITYNRRVAKNPQWGGGRFGEDSEWGSGGEAPSRQRHGVWGWSPQRWKILHFLAKIT